MAIEVQCGGCGKRYNVGEQYAGKKAKCKNCGGVMVVPQPPPVEAAPELDYDALAALESTGQIDESAPVAVAPPPLPSAATFAPSPRRGTVAPPFVKAVNQAPGRRFGFHLSRVAIALLVGGCVLGFLGIQEFRLSSASSDTPQELTCGQLEKNGPGKNAHIHLTNVTFTPQYIYKMNQSKPDDDWQMFWIPAIPTDGAYNLSRALLLETGQVKDVTALPPPPKIRVLVKTKSVKNQAQANGFIHNTSLTGMVTNQIDSLGSQERQHLEQSYPSADFSTVWIFEEGREPASAAKYMLMIGGGLALLLAGLYVMLRPS